MENYRGDLTDILRAGVGVTLASTTTPNTQDWSFSSNAIDNYSSGRIEERLDYFGDPFSNMGDPLIHEIDNIPTCSPVFHTNTPSDTNLLSRILQISPTVKVPVVPVSPCEAPVIGSVISPNTLLISSDTSNSSGLQISSPQITGIKRRKSQAKKVVCIPAAAPANSKSSGEIVPSDLWAWRKYGQKPIKGSPFPRGYYRCSSSKGCSARKQVERSRTDPNMLVITYTCEHNHPWPTQRNALAGSTRSQPTKNNNNSTPKSSPSSSAPKPDTSLKIEQQNESNANHVVSNSLMDLAVKEEAMDDFRHKIETEDTQEFGGAFAESYKPALPECDQTNEDFFAGLGEIEIDPLNLLFTQGFSGDEGGGGIKELDPFSFYDY